MATLTLGRSQAVTGPDPSWMRLYWAGGVSSLLAGVVYLVALLVNFTMPPYPTSGGAAMLEYIAAHRSVYMLEQVLWLGPGVMLMVTFLALCVALKDVDKSYATIGGVLGIASWALTLAYPATGGGAPALVYLSDQYVAATMDAQRAALAAAAEGFIAQNSIPTAIGVLETMSILIVALLMRMGVFHRGTADLGIATGVTGIVSEALRPVLGLGYTIYGVLLIVWIIAIGWELTRLARACGAARRSSNAHSGAML